MSSRAGAARAAASAPAAPRRGGVRPAPSARRVAPPRVRRSDRRRAGNWLLLIPVIAVLLAGIVWVNVSTLAFTSEAGRVASQARDVEARNIRLKAQLDRVNATVIDRAQEQLGMGVPANGSITPLQVKP